MLPNKSFSSHLKQRIQKFLLKDYSFLHDYLVVDTTVNKQNSDEQSFIAQIVGSQQMVKFTKTLFNENLLPRFQALVELYDQGAVLADNIFILQEGSKLYFYIIEAYFPDQSSYSKICQRQFQAYKTTKKNRNSSKNKYKYDQSFHNISDLSQILPKGNHNRFITLKQWINDEQHQFRSIECKAKIIDKLKILMDCVHQLGQSFAGLSSTHIIIDLEQEQNVYLAPFSLSPHLFNQNRQICSYMAPEILNLQFSLQQEHSTKKKPESELRVDAQIMKKNDIWAFGCIMLELLFFCTPAFYAINSKNQLKAIMKFLSYDKKQLKKQSNQISMLYCIQMINESKISNEMSEVGNKCDLVAKLLLNSLELNPQKRVMSSQRQNQQTNQRQIRINKITKKQQITQTKKSVPSSLNKNYIASYNQSINKQIPQEHNKYDSELILQFICVSNIKIRKQLRINIYLDKKHSIFVSSTQQASKQTYIINKSIKINNNYEMFDKLLQTPITLQFGEDGQSDKIYVNLSTLVLLADGRRAWAKPIIGSYGVKNNGYYKDAFIKIKSSLICDDQVFRNARVNERNEELVKEQQKNRIVSEQVKANQIRLLNAQQNKQNDQKMLLTKRSVQSEVVTKQKRNCFDVINQNLDQIWQKWSSKTPMQPIEFEKKFKQQHQIQMKTQQIESPVLKDRKIKQNSPTSSYAQLSITSREISNSQDQRIQQKIKEMMNKFKLK